MKRLLLYLFLLSIVNGCKTEYTVSEKKSGQTAVKDQSPDTGIEKMIQPYRDSLTKQMEVVIGSSEVEMKTGQPESLLGNWVCDQITAYNSSSERLNDREYFPTIAVMNYRGLRAPLPKGEIKIKNIYEIMPFENALVYLNLQGKDLLAMTKFLVEYGGQPVSANYRIIVETDKTFTATIDGNPIDTTATYTVITTDYLANGGDNMRFFVRAISKTETNYKLRDLLLDQIRLNTKEGIKQTAQSDGRITFK